LLDFLRRQQGPPFRIEIPFTALHWEAYEVAPYIPLARGWERQLDIKVNPIFYGAPLTPATYTSWLHEVAVRFVAVPDAKLDWSSRREATVIARRIPALRIVWQSQHWRVYEVRNATPIVDGAATLKSLGPDSLTLDVRQAGTARVRVRYTPYWALAGGVGCVEPDGDFVKLTLRSAGIVRLETSFSLARIHARSPRCT
jgi:hypothetical protein